MKSGRFLSEGPLSGDKMPSVSATSVHHAQIPSDEASHLDVRHDGNGSGDPRTNVARRFMQMLRAHDRARLKKFATRPGQAR